MDIRSDKCPAYPVKGSGMNKRTSEAEIQLQFESQTGVSSNTINENTSSNRVLVVGHRFPIMASLFRVAVIHAYDLRIMNELLLILTDAERARQISKQHHN